jgi:hypothetical protein
MGSFLAVVLISAAANPIITRHDRDDAEYLRLGGQFEQVLAQLNLETPGNPPDGEGTLIARLWVLTAAHVGVEVETGHMLTIAGKECEAETTYVHPEWDDGASDDIALIKLRRPVDGVDSAKLYPFKDEVGRVVTVVGRGDSGTGETGPSGNDGRLRGATNRVDGASDQLLWWRFDAPGDSTGNATELEGISGPGDSGGPAFAEIDGVWYLLGVSSTQSTRATAGKEGVYGVTEYYVRVSSYLDWIEETINQNSLPR